MSDTAQSGVVEPPLISINKGKLALLILFKIINF
jgi:hypothetical protein